MRALLLAGLIGSGLISADVFGQAIAYHLRTPDGKPLAGVAVTFYRESDHTLLDSQTTNGAGDCTLTNNLFLDQPLCVKAERAGWNFIGGEYETPLLPDLPNPICVIGSGLRNVYYYWGRQNLREKPAQVFGGPQGYVNPSRGEQATIVFVPNGSSKVAIDIYSLRGALLARKEIEAKGALQNSVSWDAKDSSGRTVASGIYIAHLSGAGLNEKVKIAVVSK